MRKVLEEIFQGPDPYFRHNHSVTGVSWGLVLKVHVRGRAVLANSTRNSKGEIKLFKVSPEDLQKNKVLLHMIIRVNLGVCRRHAIYTSK